MSTCAKCQTNESAPNHRYCRPCKAEYARNNRKKWPSVTSPTEEAKLKNLSRAKVKIYRRRGCIRPRPDACENCMAVGYVEAHHFDYKRPFDVVYLCRTCHGAADRKEITPNRTVEHLPEFEIVNWSLPGAQ